MACLIVIIRHGIRFIITLLVFLLIVFQKDLNRLLLAAEASHVDGSVTFL